MLDYQPIQAIQVELQGVAKLCICAALTKFKKVTISCFGRDQSVLPVSYTHLTLPTNREV